MFDLFCCGCILVLKLVKLAKGVRSLLDTLFEALPQVCNTTPLLILNGQNGGWGGLLGQWGWLGWVGMFVVWKFCLWSRIHKTSTFGTLKTYDLSSNAHLNFLRTLPNTSNWPFNSFPWLKSTMDDHILVCVKISLLHLSWQNYIEIYFFPFCLGCKPWITVPAFIFYLFLSGNSAIWSTR